ncbi:MAG: hypothetical protein RL177_380 [Bacteroidota bacterium]
MGHRWVYLCLWLLCPALLSAQETVFKYGDVGNHDFDVMPAPGQEDASAYILYDYGEFYINTDLNSIFTRHHRFRVLNQAGLTYGNVTIPYVSRKGVQTVRELKAQVYTRDETGKIHRRALRSRDFYREEFNSTYSVVKFTIPDLQPGSVVEYSYQIQSQNPLYIPSWSFQSSEPTLYSEMSAFIPNALRYAPVYTGHVRLEPPSRSDYYPRDRSEIFFTDEGGTRYRYVAQDVPPLNEEAYTSNIDNYRTSIRFNLTQIQFYGSRGTNFSNSWPSVGKNLLDDTEVGGRLRSNRDVAQLVTTVATGLTDTLDIAKAIYDHVTTQYEWTETYTFWSTRTISDVIREKNGTSGELTFLLINMLREAGIDTEPVLISTRANGMLLPMYPNPTQLDHAITRVRIAGKTYFLEANSPLLPFGLLSPASLNDRGFLLTEEDQHLITIAPSDVYRNRSMISLALNADGSGSGTLQSSNSGYQAYDLRSQMKEGNEADLYSGVLANVNELQLDSMTTVGLTDRNGPVVLNASFRSPTLGDVAGELLLVNPILMNRWETNPFTSVSRNYPIDFDYPLESSLVTIITLPEGYVVESLPENQRFGLGPDANFTILYAQNEHDVQVMCSYKISKTQFPAAQYDALRGFFDLMVEAQKQQLVLRKP